MQRQLDTLEGTHPQVTRCRDTGNGYYLTARSYPSGDAEITAIKLSSEDQLRKGGGSKRKHSCRSEQDTSVINKSARRASTTIRRKVLAIQADHMLTLTFRYNLKDIEEAWRIFAKFNRLIQKNYGGKYQYVCVPEYQKRGAVHFHLAVVGKQNINIIRHFWKKATGELGGNIDVTAPLSRKGKKLKQPKKIGNYLAKYISKTNCNKFDKKKYSTGGKIELPKPITGWLALGLEIDLALSKMLSNITKKEQRPPLAITSYYETHYIST